MQPVPSSDPHLLPALGERRSGGSRALLAAFIDRVAGVSAIGAYMQPAEYQRVMAFLFPQEPAVAGGAAPVALAPATVAPATVAPATVAPAAPAIAGPAPAPAADVSLSRLDAPAAGTDEGHGAAELSALPPMTPEEAANVPAEDVAIAAGHSFAQEAGSARLVRWPLELPGFVQEPHEPAVHWPEMATAPASAAFAEPEAVKAMDPGLAPWPLQENPQPGPLAQPVPEPVAAVPETSQPPLAAEPEPALPPPHAGVWPATPVPARDAAAAARERERQAWSGALQRSAPAGPGGPAGQFLNEGPRVGSALDWIVQKPDLPPPAPVLSASAEPRSARRIFPAIALPMTADIRGEHYTVVDWSSSAFTLENGGPLAFAGELFSARLAFAMGQVKSSVVAGCRAVTFDGGMARSFQIIDIDPQDALQLRRLSELWRSGREPGPEFLPAPAIAAPVPQPAMPGLPGAPVPGLAASPAAFVSMLDQAVFTAPVLPPRDVRTAPPPRRRRGNVEGVSRFMSLLLLFGVALVGLVVFWASMAASVPAVVSVAAAVSGRAVPVAAPADGIASLGTLAAGQQVAGGDPVARIAGPGIPVLSPCTCTVTEITVADGTQVLAGRTLAIFGLMPKDTIDVDALFPAGKTAVQEGQMAAVRFDSTAKDLAGAVVAVSPDAVDVTRAGLSPKPGTKGLVRITVSVPRRLAPAGLALGSPATVSVRAAAAWRFGTVLGFDVDSALAALWQRVHGKGKG